MMWGMKIYSKKQTFSSNLQECRRKIIRKVWKSVVSFNSVSYDHFLLVHLTIMSLDITVEFK